MSNISTSPVAPMCRPLTLSVAVKNRWCRLYRLMIPLIALSISRNCLAHLHQLRIRLPSRFSSVARTLIPYFINSVIYVEQSTMVVGSHDGFIIENAEHDCYHLSDWCQVCLFHGLCAVFLQSLARCLVTKKQKHVQRNTSWPTLSVPPLPCCAALPLPVLFGVPYLSADSVITLIPFLALFRLTPRRRPPCL